MSRKIPLVVFLLALTASLASADIGLVADIDGDYTNGPDTLRMDPGDTVQVNIWITGADSLVGFGITLGDTAGALEWLQESASAIYSTPGPWTNTEIVEDAAGWLLIQASDFSFTAPLHLPSKVAEMDFVVAPGESCGVIAFDPEMSGWQNWEFAEGPFALSSQSTVCADSVVSDSGGSDLDGGGGAEGQPDGAGMANGVPSELSNFSQVDSRPDAFFTSPRWSPDGSMIAYLGRKSLKIANANEPEHARTFHTGTINPMGYEWSGDGSAIYFQRADTEYFWRLHMYRIVLPGEAPELVERSTGYAGFPHRIDSGIAFYSIQRDEVVAYAREGRVQQLDPTPSFAFSKDDEEIYVASGQGIDRVTSDGRASHYFAPILSPNKERIVVCALRPIDGIYLLELSSGEKRFLGVGSSPSWHPSGEWILFEKTIDGIQKVLESDLYAVSIDGIERRLTDTQDFIEMKGQFSPDGMHVVFESSGSVYVAEVIYE